MNPILPKPYFIPDVEARVMSDGRLYLYGSFDISGEAFYCSPKLNVFSSGDLQEWVDHGESFSVEHSHSPDATRIFAPDCVEYQGQFYQFYCADDWSEGVAVSERPHGPFRQATAVAGADKDGIDPAVLLDEDGQCYYFWGQFVLRGARMLEDLRGLDPSTFRSNLLNESVHGFHEGASIRKRKGLYYLVYTDLSVSGRATALSYAVASQPLGPYEKKGVLIDNFGCDPATWNNHGSIEAFRGQWYLFYHRSYHNNRHNRRLCVEPITFDEDGQIGTVEMTTQGVSGPLDPEKEMEAFRACRLTGGLKTAVIYPQKETDPWVEYLSGAKNGESAEFRYFRFENRMHGFEAVVGSATGRGWIEVRIDHERGPLLAKVPIPETGGWHRWQRIRVPLKSFYAGVHSLILLFKGHEGNLGNLHSFRFRRE